jgi:hypothetical protein
MTYEFGDIKAFLLDGSQLPLLGPVHAFDGLIATYNEFTRDVVGSVKKSSR